MLHKLLTHQSLHSHLVNKLNCQHSGAYVQVTLVLLNHGPKVPVSYAGNLDVLLLYLIYKLSFNIGMYIYRK